MAQNTTTIPQKSTGQTLTAVELNELNNTVNNNANDAQSRLSLIEGTYVESGDNVSDLANDALYVSSGDNVSDLANDALYVSSGDNVSLLVNDENYLTGVSAGTNVTIDNTNPLNPIINSTVNSTVDDTAYGTSWDSNTDAATKNAIYDKIESVSKTWLITKMGNEDDDASGTGEKAAWVAPAAGKIYAVHSACSTVTAGGTITIDVKKEGVSILGTLGVIASGGDSTISGTPHVLTTTPTSFAAGDRISFEINAIGATSGAKGLHTDLQVSWD